ncbi:MAG: carbon-nitrogen hydrolase family protein [Peptococcaceae bacterium]|nr:carbon-nitrogen hydrolase family protein [Peptococcaceae bacterium]
MNRFKVSICQMSVSNEKQKNLSTASDMIKMSAAEGANLVILPEMFICPYDLELFQDYSENYPEGETLRMLSKIARNEKIYLVGGSLPERQGKRIYNSSFIFDPQGEVIGKHRKIHLFDSNLDKDVCFKESEVISSGDTITVVNTAHGPIGVAICYDLRFPEIFRLMSLSGAILAVVPAAFNDITGPAHWEMLLRSRAVDNQFYLAGASPARYQTKSLTIYGHSMLVDPWGEVIAKAGEEEQLVIGEIFPDRLTEIRDKLPLLKHRRTDLYDVYNK